MKYLLMISLLALVPCDAKRYVGVCDPYADTCRACSDCSKCHWCHDKGGTCSVCLEKGRKKTMARLTVHPAVE